MYGASYYSGAPYGNNTQAAALGIVSASAAGAAATVNAPTLVLGGVTVSASSVNSTAVANTPTLVLGTITLSSSAVALSTTVNDAALILGIFNTSPGSSGVVGIVSAPSLILGGISVSASSAAGTCVANDATTESPFVFASVANSAAVVNSPTLIVGPIIILSTTSGVNATAANPGAVAGNINVALAVTGSPAGGFNPSTTTSIRNLPVAALVIHWTVPIVTVDGGMPYFPEILCVIHSSTGAAGLLGRGATVGTMRFRFGDVLPAPVRPKLIFPSVEATDGFTIFPNSIGNAPGFFGIDDSEPLEYTLTGFMTPNSPIQSSRLFANPDGSIEFVVLENLGKTEPIPSLEVLLSKESGPEINLLVDDQANSSLFSIPNDGPTKSLVFRTRNQDLLLAPGTYTIRVLRDGNEIFNKSLTVRNHPALR